MAIVQRVAAVDLSQVVEALLAEVNGRLDEQNLAIDAIRAAMMPITESDLAPDSVGASELKELVDLTKPVVTSLPGSPTDGEVIYYKVTDDYGEVTIWTFKYRSASSYSSKWEFIGGSPMSRRIATSEARTSATYGDLTTTGPTLTVPLAGDYIIEHGTRIIGSALSVAHMSYAIGGTAAVDADAVVYGASGQASVARSKLQTGIAASTAFAAKYRSSDGVSSVSFLERYMRVFPVRVG